VHFGGAATFALVHHLAFAGQRRGHIGQRRQVAAGADRAFFGNQRQDVVLEKGLHALEQLDAHARNAVGQRA